MTNKSNMTERQADTLERMVLQLREWSVLLDDLLAKNIHAGGHETDPYRIRLDRARAERDALMRRFDEFDADAEEGFAAFNSAVKDSWNELKSDVQQLVAPDEPRHSVARKQREARAS